MDRRAERVVSIIFPHYAKAAARSKLPRTDEDFVNNGEWLPEERNVSRKMLDMIEAFVGARG